MSLQWTDNRWHCDDKPIYAGCMMQLRGQNGQWPDVRIESEKGGCVLVAYVFVAGTPFRHLLNCETDQLRWPAIKRKHGSNLSLLQLEIDERELRLLATLDEQGDVARVVSQLIDHAQQGVYRPGAWERGWLLQAFGDEFESRLEPDPEQAFFARPRPTVEGNNVSTS